MGKTRRGEASACEAFPALMSDVGRLWRARLNARLAPFGLTHPLWRVLAEASAAPLAQTELARRLCIEHPTLVKWLDRLEHDGWVSRSPDARDRRVRIVRLAGDAARWRRVQATVSELRRETLGALSPDEAALIVQSLDRLRRRLFVD